MASNTVNLLIVHVDCTTGRISLSSSDGNVNSNHTVALSSSSVVLVFVAKSCLEVQLQVDILLQGLLGYDRWEHNSTDYRGSELPDTFHSTGNIGVESSGFIANVA